MEYRRPQLFRTLQYVQCHGGVYELRGIFWIRCTVLVLVFGMYRPHGEIRHMAFAHGCRIFVLRVGTWYFSGIGDLRVILLFVLGSRS